MRIALLEDDSIQAKVISHALAQDGHSCIVFTDGRSLLKALRSETFDMLVLDWELPDMSGQEVLQWVRKYLPDRVPVLFCTSRSDEEDIVAALRDGADDYMVKPLRLAELLARVSALERRSRTGTAGSRMIELANVRIDLERRMVFVDEAQVALTGKEFDLAVAFFSNPGKVLSRTHLLDHVWGYHDAVETRTLDTYVSRLRKRLGLAPEFGWSLSSIYQYGYRLEHRPPV